MTLNYYVKAQVQKLHTVCTVYILNDTVHYEKYFWSILTFSWSLFLVKFELIKDGHIYLSKYVLIQSDYMKNALDKHISKINADSEIDLIENPLLLDFTKFDKKVVKEISFVIFF